MNPNARVHAAVSLNGDVTHFGETEFKRIPMMLARFIMQADMSSRDFSTLELRVNKRPIAWDVEQSAEQAWIEEMSRTTPIQTVGLDDPIDDESPLITYRELQELSNDPIWTAYKGLSTRGAAENTTGDEYHSIVTRWKDKYARTKFARLI